MTVCYFDQDYDKQFNCEYEVKQNSIEVTVNYDIQIEIEPVNGYLIIGGTTKFKKRDILIIDAKNSINYLLKESHYAGHSNRYGTPDDVLTTKFRSNIYFISNDYDKLCNLPSTPKVKKIKIFSKDIITLFGCPSLTTIKNDDEYILSFKNESQSNSINLNKHYIKNIKIGDSWHSNHSYKTHCIKTDLNGYIELELTKKVNYDLVQDFVYELMLFMQLYHPDKFIINKILVLIDKNMYKIVAPIPKLEYKEKDTEASINDNLLDYLSKCYTLIPYRKSKTEIRNIPYIIMNTSRGIEDNFLMFYRFIECYYKKQGITTFIAHCIKNNYISNEDLSEEEIERYSQEIVSLRNHYVHAGYYIKNSSLRISFDKINRKKNPKDYSANVDIDWIYKRTKILYRSVIDIIFSNMLGYEKYQFNKHF